MGEVLTLSMRASNNEYQNDDIGNENITVRLNVRTTYHSKYCFKDNFFKRSHKSHIYYFCADF